MDHSWIDFQSDDLKLWERKSPKIKIKPSSKGANPLVNYAKQSRLIVITYDSTSVLEFMNLNFPIVCFWKNALDEIIESALPYYKDLMDVGILHSDYNSASKHIINHWKNIDLWWKEEKN